MNSNKGCLVVILLLISQIFILNPARAQGTAFTYQGRLNDANGLASGSYDFQFGLYATNAGGAAIAGPVTNSAILVSNGLFLAAIDFGSVFNGTNYWLEVAVRTNGGTVFTELNPRQPITPAPTALFANTAGTVSGPVSASQVSGVLPLVQLDTNALRALAAAQAAQMFATSAIPAGNLVGILSQTNLPASLTTNLLNGAIINALQAGCVNDGVTDNSGALQKLFNQGGTIILPPGSYAINHILYLTNNTVIWGYGATLVLNPGYTGAALCNCFNTHCAIYGLTVEGGQHTSPGALTFTDFRGTHTLSTYLWFTDSGTAGLGYWQGNLARHGIVWSSDTGSVLKDVAIDGFSGVGLLGCSSSGQNAPDYPASSYQGINISYCMVGVSTTVGIAFQNGVSTPWITNYVSMAVNNPGSGNDVQYAVFDKCHVFQCGVAVDAGGANNCFSECNLDNNWTAFATIAGTPSGVTGHSRAVGCSANHNYGPPVMLNGISSGFKMIGCAFRGNASESFLINNSAEVVIRACELDALPCITNSSSVGNNYFLDNIYAGTWSPNTISNDGKLVIAGNFSSTVVGNTDGSGMSRIAYNDAGGLTNLNAAQLIGQLPLGASNLNTIVSLVVTQALQTISTSSIPPVQINVGMTNITVQALGGTNDDTAVFAAAFNSGVPVICPVGDFNVTNIVIHNDNEVVYGYGCRLHMAGNATGYVISTRGMTNVSIAGLSVYGGFQQSPGWMMGSAPSTSWCDYNCVTLPLGLNTPANARSGFFCNMQGRSRFADLTANGFNVAGFYLSNPLGFGAAGTPVGIFQNNFADWCYIGFELPQSLHSCDFTTNNVYQPYDAYGANPGFGGADYTILNAPVAHNCTFGINDGAWNVPINNPQISACAIGICICDNTHNTITGGSLNHESGGAGLAYFITGGSQGPVIVGQEILDNPWNVYAVQAGSVTFSSCQFNPGQILATNLTGAVVFMNCITNGGTVTTDNTGLSFVNCYGPGFTNASFFAGTSHGSVPIDTNGLLALAAVQTANQIATSSIPAGNITTGVLNPVLATNPAVVYNELPYTTNTYLLAYNAGAQLQYAAATTYGVSLRLGDSMTGGINGTYGSAERYLLATLQSLDGCAGFGGSDHNYGGNWDNCPAPLGRGIDYNVWCQDVEATLYAADGSNALTSTEGFAGNANTATNYCTQVGLQWMQTPGGGDVAVQLSSKSMGAYYQFTISGYATSTNYMQTNWPVAGGNDWRVALTSLQGTNILLSADFLATNGGIQDWCYAKSGATLDNMLATGTNNLARMYAAINPQFIIYHAKDIGEQPSGLVMSNKLVQLLQYAPTNAQIVIVGTPPIQTGTYQDQNYYYQQVCQAHGWYYADLWSSFNNFQANTNAGLMADSTHPSPLGCVAWGSRLFNLCGFSPALQNKQMLANSLVGVLPLSVLPVQVVTNGSTGSTLNTLNVTGGVNYRSTVWGLAALTNGMNTGDFKVVSSNGLALVSIWMTNGVPVLKQLAP